MRKHPILTLLVPLALLVPLVGPAEAQAATGTISPITRVAVGNAATTAGFAWHTARTTSSSAAQPVTGLAWGPAASFSCANSTLAGAAAPTTTVYDRVSYSQVTLTGLSAGTEYAYCVISNGGERTETAKFTTAKSSGATTLLAFADANWRSTATYGNYFNNTVSKALEAYPQAAFAVHTGAMSSISDKTHADGFVDHISSVLPELTWAPTSQTYGALNRFHQYAFATPTESTYEASNYAVRYPNVLLLVINSRRTATAQLNATVTWIKEQIDALGTAKASTWVIAAIPTQFYGSTSIASTYRTKVHEAFYANGVSLVLQGGAKAYTRSWPVNTDKSKPVWYDYPSQASSVATKDGVVYVTPGASGIEKASLSTLATTSSTSWLQAWSPNPANTAEAQAADKKSYSAITATAAELKLTARQADGTTLDSFTINRGATPVDDPNQPSASLTAVGLNNGFGTNPKAERTITWLLKNSEKWRNVKFLYRVSGTTAETQADVTAKTMGNELYTYTSYTVKLKGLAAGTKYEYRILATKNTVHGNDWVYGTQYYSFSTSTLANQTFTFIDFADSQGSTAGYDKYWGNNLRTALANTPQASFVTHTGDIIDSPTLAQYEAWMNASGDSLANVAFNPVLGNHDYGATRGTGLYAQLFNRDTAHFGECPAPAGFPLTYAYRYSNAYFVNINSNPANAAGVTSIIQPADLAKLSAWIECTVTVDRKTAPNHWLIVTMHKSPYGGIHAGETYVSQGDLGGAKNLRDALTPLFNKLGVALVLSGHDHNLIRSYPVKWDGSAPVYGQGSNTVSTSRDGTVYYIPRNSGEKTISVTKTGNGVRPWINFLWNQNGEVSGSTKPELDVYSAITVSISSIAVKTYTVDGTLRDTFTIVK